MTTIDVLVELGRNLANTISMFSFCQIDFSQDITKYNKSIFHRSVRNLTWVKNTADMEKNLSILVETDYVLNSQVELLDGRVCHLPLLDFCIEKNSDDINKILETLVELDVQTGYIMDSGLSYHFIGSKPLEEERYKKMLYKALLIPTIDGRWVAHQLLNGASCLRIGIKNGVKPTLIKKINCYEL